MRCALVRIDRMKLALRLFRALGHWPDEPELRQWLKDNGLIWIGGSWFSSNDGPTVLLPEEILESATTETSEGITFIDRRSATPERRGTGPRDQPESA
jgi:hypothetical protein